MSKQGFGFRFSGLMGFIAMILVLVFMYFIITGAWKLLAIAAPVLIVLALIINYKTIVNFLRFMLGLLQRNVLSGIIAIILCVVLFPFLSGILFWESHPGQESKQAQESTTDPGAGRICGLRRSHPP